MTKPQKMETPRVAYVQARWHAAIVDQALVGFRDVWDAGPLKDGVVDVFDVPGAFEMPLTAKKLAQSGRYDAVVCAALVVDGGIYRHDFVAQSVVDGLMQVGLETGVPVFSVSLTPHHFQETAAHEGFFKEHFVLKGQEAARAVMQMMALEIA